MVPLDSVLLLAAALALVVAVRAGSLPLWALTALRLLASALLILGIVFTLLSLRDVYRVGITDLLHYAFLDLARGVVLVALAVLLRHYALRREVSVGK